ncbi:hypothetical protein VTJ49DRAFT_7438 [Mycothermus thermophilus]|uniref:Uncharacterized protein n=1 Tax=Humicola insolens TaxID=85995 RepID=A0ABR3VGY8_HUMIN
MVSFFGLRVGGKKKKPDGKPPPPQGKQQQQQQQQQQWKRIDQNALGEGQFFGKNVNRQPNMETGSIRSVSRAATPQGGRPYVHQDTHNLAAVSMIDLSTSVTVTGRPGTPASFTLRPHASEANMRARFGANNGSSTSLALPGPGFGARLAARNGSATSLALPAPGFGSRPGTPSRTKPWVNPLDVHFARTVPTGPPAVPNGPSTPKSPPVDSPRLPPTPSTENAETRSVFGEEADDMVTAVMASVKKREEEEREAKKREAELEKQRETARLEMERLERQKSTESSLSARRPSAPAQPEPEPEPNFDIPPALLKDGGESSSGNRSSPPESNSGNRGGPPPPHAVHQGPPPTGPPTQSLPQPPGQNPPRQGPLGPARPYTSYNSNNRADGTASNNGSQKVFKPYRPPPLQGCGPLGPLPDRLRSPSPTLKGAGLAVMAQSPALPQSPTLHSPPLMEHHPVVVGPEPETPKSRGPGTPAPEKQEPGPLLSSLTSPSTVTSPTGSIRRMSLDDEPAEPSARPIIQNVRAKRDTLALSAARNNSLSMRIEELEKTLLRAQIANQADPVPTRDASEADRSSTTSSVYSAAPQNLDEDEDDGPILTIQPAPPPLRVPHPPMPPAPPAISSPPSRPQSPMRGPPRRGPMPRRPALEEYGVSASHVVRGRGTPTPGSRSGSTDNHSIHSSPPSRTDSPQIRQPANWRRDLKQPSPAPTLDNAADQQQNRSKPAVDTGLGFNFDFGPGPNLSMAPPTPDSTTWPLASPVNGGSDAASAPPASDPSSKSSDAPTKFTRANVPPPLNIDLTKFNFNPDAPSRDPAHGGLWTPPIRSVPWANTTADGRPSTSSGAPGPGSFGHGGHGNGGSKLAASPSLVSQFPESKAAANDEGGSFMGIGMARGPSIREIRRPKTSGGPGSRRPGPGSAMVDSFGTSFI